MTNVSTCITYDASTSLVMMTLRGMASAQDVINFYQIAHQYSLLYGSDKILVDVSELTHNFEPADLFTIMPVVANTLKRAVIAIVVSFDGFMHDLFVQKAKRYNVHAENFECFQTAKNWLIEQ
ncbi:hypothetical protein D0907_17775 (plasmid) [Pseudoalteromonas lipolytica]|uniref:Uncharacterized protein n=2 Tax=Pseudoalteromonas TaxID=53246 RepID=A0AAD0S397_9GAMM|nr:MULTISPECIES: hypothetical protein [Pseudoalteromonas]AXV67171.1 hypothetical protein D0907_17775 [Pseudoalteromonas donghaensis]QLJ10422.1 hypothetical protein GZH31_17060 [Pseudoalteromonas sp. JSTW]SFT73727.1 hypothetical protein SAMN04487854_108154 [Pseudoalteromonas lipolytica]EWH05680.1 hypothetical protein AT00_15820 [Pseudoalteromonas lipolytica SCSIO 04301]MCC9660506.1 hypothetical protein [Pseudoalteromonas sp. MB41]